MVYLTKNNVNVCLYNCLLTCI